MAEEVVRPPVGAVEPKFNLKENRANLTPDRRTMERRAFRYDRAMEDFNSGKDRRVSMPKLDYSMGNYRDAELAVKKATYSPRLARTNAMGRVASGAKDFVKDNLPMAATIAGFEGISRVAKDLPQNVEKVIRTGKQNESARSIAEHAADRGQPLQSGVVERVNVTPESTSTDTSYPGGTSKHTEEPKTWMNLIMSRRNMILKKYAKK